MAALAFAAGGIGALDEVRVSGDVAALAVAADGLGTLRRAGGREGVPAVDGHSALCIEQPAHHSVAEGFTGKGLRQGAIAIDQPTDDRAPEVDRKAFNEGRRRAGHLYDRRLSG